MTYEEKLEELESRWLRGSTCHRPRHNKVHWKSDCGRFVVMKHTPHSEYMGTFSPSANCNARYYLYDLEQEGYPNESGEPCVKKWEGRFLKTYWTELKQLIEDERSN